MKSKQELKEALALCVEVLDGGLFGRSNIDDFKRLKFQLDGFDTKLTPEKYLNKVINKSVKNAKARLRQLQEELER